MSWFCLVEMAGGVEVWGQCLHKEQVTPAKQTGPRTLGSMPGRTSALDRKLPPKGEAPVAHVRPVGVGDLRNKHKKSFGGSFYKYKTCNFFCAPFLLLYL